MSNARLSHNLEGVRSIVAQGCSPFLLICIFLLTGGDMDEVPSVWRLGLLWETEMETEVRVAEKRGGQC